MPLAFKLYYVLKIYIYMPKTHILEYVCVSFYIYLYICVHIFICVFVCSNTYVVGLDIIYPHCLGQIIIIAIVGAASFISLAIVVKSCDPTLNVYPDWKCTSDHF